VKAAAEEREKPPVPESYEIMNKTPRKKVLLDAPLASNHH
jgi:hypothetical protein